MRAYTSVLHGHLRRAQKASSCTAVHTTCHDGVTSHSHPLHTMGAQLPCDMSSLHTSVADSPSRKPGNRQHELQAGGLEPAPGE